MIIIVINDNNNNTTNNNNDILFVLYIYIYLYIYMCVYMTKDNHHLPDPLKLEFHIVFRKCGHDSLIQPSNFLGPTLGKNRGVDTYSAANKKCKELSLV
jgi:hypothetical protein